MLIFVILIGGCAKKPENTNLTAGMELVEQYDFQGAMEKFEQALLDKEDMELSYRGQGIAYMGLGNYADAETAFLNAIKFAGDRLTALEYDINYYLASAYMKQKKYAQAEEIYSAIITLKKKKKKLIICAHVQYCGKIAMTKRLLILRKRLHWIPAISSW